MSDYAFAGEVIKVTQKDFDKWQQLYVYLDLMAELEQMDMEFHIRTVETGKPIKGWFSECFARLNGRNKRGGNERRANPNRPVGQQRRQGHAEQTRGQATRAIQRIDSQVSDFTLYPDG